MLTRPQIYLASIFIKIFYRDRQSLFFSLLFPLIFTGIFLFSGGEPSPTKLGLVNHSKDELSIKFVELVKKEKTFLVKDLKSRNGTFINNKRMKEGTTERVSSGTSLYLGKENAAFTLEII